MDAILNAINNPLVLTLIGLLTGVIVKKTPEFPTRAVPLFNLVIALVVKVGAAAFGPGQVHAAELGVIVALPPFLAQLGNACWQAVLQTLLTTGIHSAGKNTAQLVRRTP